MANEVVNRRLNIYIDQATAEQSLERLTKKENDLVAAIERQKKAGKDATRQMNELADTRNRIGQIKDVMDGKVLPSIRMAEAAVQKLNRELKSLPANSEAAAQKLQQLRAAEATLVRVRNAANGVNTSLNDIGKNQGFLGRIQNGLGSLLGNGGLLAGGILAGGAIFGQAVTFLSNAVTEALQAEEATARFRAQLENLGRLDVFERLSQEADDLADSFRFLDNDEIIGVFEKLIDYGKLTEAQIKQLTPVIIDFAAKQRIDLGTATEVITKALEGNGKALKTYGVDIKDAKDVTEAFGIVMTELKPKVDGAAAAFGETTEGQIRRTRQEIANLQEDLGTKFLPFIKLFLQTVTDGIGWIERLFTAGTIYTSRTQLGADIEARQGFLKKLADDFEQYSKSVQRKQIFTQSELIQQLGADLKTASGQRKALLAQRFQEEVQLFNQYLEIFRRNNGQTVGINSGGTSDEEKRRQEEAAREAKRLRDQAKRDRDQAQKDLTDVLNKTEEATKPILAAYRKINEQATEDIKKIQNALKLGLISPEQAEQALAGVERVLNESRDKLNQQFSLTSGLLNIIPEGGDMDAAMQADAKALGTNIGNTIIEAVAGTIAEDDPIKKWLQDPENQELLDQAFSIARDLSDLFVNIGQVRANAEQAAFDKEVANNEKRKESAQKLLESKLISQQEYNRRVSQIDKQQGDRERELRKRQFERDKNAQTAQALISGAQAQLTTLARFGAPIPPNFLGIAANVLTLAVTAANIAAIRSAKPPQFAKGGFLPEGPSHAQGGIALVDRAGRKVGEVEGGEPILSRKTYARNKPLIDMLMAGSLSGTGIMTMNVPRINNSMRTVFENGGFIPKAGDVSSNELTTAVKDLNQILANGIIAKMLYGEYENTSDRINAIRSQSRVS